MGLYAERKIKIFLIQVVFDLYLSEPEVHSVESFDSDLSSAISNQCSDTSCWGKGFHDGDRQEQIRSETMHKIADLSQDNTHRTPEFT